MRVALVCPYDLGRFGGVQDQVVKLATWLRSSGDDVVMVGPGVEGPEGAVLLGPTRVVKANAASTPISFDPRIGGKVAAAVEGCDVVHVHEPLMPTVSIGAMRRVEQPIVATFHADPSPITERAYGGGRALVRRLLWRAAVVTAVSPVAARVVPAGIAVRLVPNGVDVAAYPDIPRDPMQVVFLGRDDPRKGLRALLEAWPAVRARVGGAQLVVMGTDRVADAPSDVEFMGRVSEETKRATLAGAGVLCAPNTSGESFGIVVAEGMAAGCAVVASALPGFVHAAGQAGVLVKPGDTDGLAAALIMVLEDEVRAAELRSRSLERVARFDRDAVLTAYQECYRDAMVR